LLRAVRRAVVRIRRLNGAEGVGGCTAAPPHGEPHEEARKEQAQRGARKNANTHHAIEERSKEGSEGVDTCRR